MTAAPPGGLSGRDGELGLTGHAHISQSGVSAQIRQLERELGAELPGRSARTATLPHQEGAAMDIAAQRRDTPRSSPPSRAPRAPRG